MEVKIFVVCTYRISSRINWWKNFENWFTFDKVIIKHQVASCFWDSILSPWIYSIYLAASV